MNEININDKISKALKALTEALESIIDMFNKLETYQKYELLHPRKKPRGSIRRARQGRLSE